MLRVELFKEELDKIKREQEDPNFYLDSMLKRFKKQVIESGVLEECRRREFFLKKSLARKEKSKRAKIRLIKNNKLKGRKSR